MVEQIDAYWQVKHTRVERDTAQSTLGDMHIPRNTPIGVFLGFFAVVVGFALIWRIDWLAVIGLAGALVVVLRQSWSTDRETRVPAEQVAAVEHSHAIAALGSSQAASTGRA